MMAQEHVARTLADEKYSKKKVVKCSEGHCTTTVEPTKEKTV